MFPNAVATILGPYLARATLQSKDFTDPPNMDDKRIQGPLSLHPSFWHVNPSIIGSCSGSMECPTVHKKTPGCSRRPWSFALSAQKTSGCSKGLCIHNNSYFWVFWEAPPPQWSNLGGHAIITSWEIGTNRQTHTNRQIDQQLPSWSSQDS